jgi:hypothetical protein
MDLALINKASALWFDKVHDASSNKELSFCFFCLSFLGFAEHAYFCEVKAKTFLVHE